MYDKTFRKRVKTATLLAAAFETPELGNLQHCLLMAVWPALNRFARFSEPDKLQNLDDFNKLIKATAGMIDRYEANRPPGPVMKTIGAKRD